MFTVEFIEGEPIAGLEKQLNAGGLKDAEGRIRELEAQLAEANEAFRASEADNVKLLAERDSARRAAEAAVKLVKVVTSHRNRIEEALKGIANGIYVCHDAHCEAYKVAQSALEPARQAEGGGE